MAIPRFYLPPQDYALGDEKPLEVGSLLLIGGSLFQYIRRVRRLRDGDDLVLFDGAHFVYDAEIQASKSDKDKTLTVLIKAVAPASEESRLSVHLVTALIANDKFDLLIQKAVELGVHSIYPVTTAYTQFSQSLDASAKARKYQHWQNIIIAACEQCGCNVLPRLHPLTPWQHLLSPTHLATQALYKKLPTIKLMAHPITYPNDLPPIRVHDWGLALSKDGINAQHENINIALAIGPEGGFSEDEVKLAIAQSWQSISLGRRLLRAETAAIVALAQIKAVLNVD